MIPGAAPQLLSKRKAVQRAGGTPWSALEPVYESVGGRLVRIGKRDLVIEEYLARAIESCRLPTVAESADRVGLAMDQALEEMGLAKRARARGTKITAVQAGSAVCAPKRGTRS